MRGYVDLHEDVVDSDDPASEMKKEIRARLINELVAKWNSIHKRIEARQWSYESNYSTIQENLESTYEQAYELALREDATPTEAHWKAREAVQEMENSFQAEENKLLLEAEVIEEMLQTLGARMMRPYEHWNEEERYMEWAESRYDYDYPYDDY